MESGDTVLQRLNWNSAKGGKGQILLCEELIVHSSNTIQKGQNSHSIVVQVDHLKLYEGS